MQKQDLRIVAAIALFYVLLESGGISCPILYLTGVSCAGCGMSRAWLALLRGNFAGAFVFHPLFWLPVPTGALLLFRRKLPTPFFRWGMTAVCALALVVYAVRMLSGTDPVVVFRPWEGLIARILSVLLKGCGLEPVPK